jgi:hypothetical protein
MDPTGEHIPDLGGPKGISHQNLSAGPLGALVAPKPINSMTCHGFERVFTVFRPAFPTECSHNVQVFLMIPWISWAILAAISRKNSGQYPAILWITGL